MAHPNRVQIIELGDSWQDYARMIPDGFTPLGTVKRLNKIHAFARDQAGAYWIFGDGRPEPLPQAKMQRAIAAILTRNDDAI